MVYRQVWHCVWGNEDHFKEWSKKGTPFITAERLTADFAKAAEQGAKDNEWEANRAGAVNFGQELRQVLSLYPDSGVPVWVLEALLKKWNIPEALQKGTTHESNV